MAFGVERIKYVLDGLDPWAGLVGISPHLVDVARVLAGSEQSPVAIQSAIVDLHQRYCDEWEQFSIDAAALVRKRVA